MFRSRSLSLSLSLSFPLHFSLKINKKAYPQVRIKKKSLHPQGEKGTGQSPGPWPACHLGIACGPSREGWVSVRSSLGT